ncbi:MAG: BatD family protein [Pseudomonadota bacterium]|nr:BatD family protein [Pseudomonadota bacterium]
MIPFALVQAAFAAQVTLQVDSEQLREGQKVRLDLMVVDTSPRSVPRFDVPAGLEIAYEGQSQQRQIINFQSTSSTIFSYSLTALAAGEYDIGPITVPTAAGALTTTALHLKVTPRAPGSDDSLVGDIGTDHAWVGQVLVYHLRFQTEKNVVTGQWTPPSPAGFTTEPTVEPMTAEYTLEQDGKPLSVQELYFPLRASAPGKWTIPGGVLRAQYSVTDTSRRRRQNIFDGIGAYGSVRTEAYSAGPLAIDVRELPAEGRPADATGLVGHYTVAARASGGSTRVGDTVTVEVVVEGDGALAGFSLPPLAGTDFRVYDDQPIVEARIEDGKYHAKATFKRAIVPQGPGVIQVPPIEIAYFDPSTGAWGRASTQPITLDVSGEAVRADVESFANGGAQRSVDTLGEDILPVRTDARLSRPWPRAAALAWLAPGAFALTAQGVLALRRRKPRGSAERPRGFDDLPQDPDARLAAIERIFRERVAARVGVPPDALRREDLCALGPSAEEAETIYRALERRRYGGQDATVSEERVRTLVEGLG